MRIGFVITGHVREIANCAPTQKAHLFDLLARHEQHFFFCTWNKTNVDDLYHRIPILGEIRSEIQDTNVREHIYKHYPSVDAAAVYDEWWSDFVVADKVDILDQYRDNWYRLGEPVGWEMERILMQYFLVNQAAHLVPDFARMDVLFRIRFDTLFTAPFSQVEALMLESVEKNILMIREDRLAFGPASLMKLAMQYYSKNVHWFTDYTRPFEFMYKTYLAASGITFREIQPPMMFDRGNTSLSIA